MKGEFFFLREGLFIHKMFSTLLLLGVHCSNEVKVRWCLAKLPLRSQYMFQQKETKLNIVDHFHEKVVCSKFG